MRQNKDFAFRLRQLELARFTSSISIDIPSEITAARLMPRRAAYASTSCSKLGSTPRLIVSFLRFVGVSAWCAESGAPAINLSGDAVPLPACGRLVIVIPYSSNRCCFDIDSISIRYRINGVPIALGAKNRMHQSIDFSTCCRVSTLHFLHMKARTAGVRICFAPAQRIWKQLDIGNWEIAAAASWLSAPCWSAAFKKASAFSSCTARASSTSCAMSWSAQTSNVRGRHGITTASDTVSAARSALESRPPASIIVKSYALR